MKEKPELRYACTLSDAELSALGRITYFWACIDDFLFQATLWWAEHFKVKLTPQFKASSFNTRREAWRSLVLELENKIPADSYRTVKKRALSADGQITRAEERRKILTHGVAIKTGSSSILFHRQWPPKPIDHEISVADLNKFVDELSRLAAEMSELTGYWARPENRHIGRSAP